MASQLSLSECLANLSLVDRRFSLVLQSVRNSESSAADRGRELLRAEAALSEARSRPLPAAEEGLEDDKEGREQRAAEEVKALEEVVRGIKEREEGLTLGELKLRCDQLTGLALAEGDEATLLVTCSSPIEQAELSVSTSSSSSLPSSISFVGVDRDVAILQLSVKSTSSSAILGVSASLDAMPLCYLTDDWMLDESNVVNANATMQTREVVSVVKVGSDESLGFDAADGQCDPDRAGTGGVGGGDANLVCRATLTFEFRPSRQERHDRCVEILASLGRDKAELTKRVAELQAEAGEDEEGDELEEMQSAAAASKGKKRAGAVKAGFLNKAASPPSAAAGQPKAAPKDPPRWRSLLASGYATSLRWFSFAVAVAPVAKNYLFFFAAVAAIHFKGDELLALPPPI